MKIWKIMDLYFAASITRLYFQFIKMSFKGKKNLACLVDLKEISAMIS